MTEDVGIGEICQVGQGIAQIQGLPRAGVCGRIPQDEEHTGGPRVLQKVQQGRQGVLQKGQGIRARTGEGVRHLCTGGPRVQGKAVQQALHGGGLAGHRSLQFGGFAVGDTLCLTTPKCNGQQHEYLHGQRYA